jgi:hypothetical protein
MFSPIRSQLSKVGKIVASADFRRRRYAPLARRQRLFPQQQRHCAAAAAAAYKRPLPAIFPSVLP